MHKSVAKIRTKQLPCSGCGALMTVGSNTRNKPRCVECGVKAFRENQESMRSHSGPSWDKWLARTSAFRAMFP